MVLDEELTVMSGVTDGVTATVIDPDGRAGLEGQLRLERKTTLTESPLFREAVVNDILSDPTFTPFLCHWNDGVNPPLE
jgi:hypothetical protein